MYPPKKFFMAAILQNNMASIDREYSPFYNSFFLVVAVDRPSILIVYCSMTSVECNNSEIILKIDFQIIIIKIKRTKISSLNDKNIIKLKLIRILKKKVLLHSTQNCTLTHLNPRVLYLSNLCYY